MDLQENHPNQPPAKITAAPDIIRFHQLIKRFHCKRLCVLIIAYIVSKWNYHQSLFGIADHFWPITCSLFPI